MASSFNVLQNEDFFVNVCTTKLITSYMQIHTVSLYLQFHTTPTTKLQDKVSV